MLTHRGCSALSSPFALTCCVAVPRDRVLPGRWRILGALLHGSIVVPPSVDPGTSGLARHARAATQNDTEMRQDAEVARRNSDPEKGDLKRN